MERFHIGKGLVILCEGHTLQFSGRTGPTLHFKDAANDEFHRLTEQQFWRQVEKGHISLIARAFQDPVSRPFIPAPRCDDTVPSSVMYAPRHLGKTKHKFDALLGAAHVAPLGDLAADALY